MRDSLVFSEEDDPQLRSRQCSVAASSDIAGRGRHRTPGLADAIVPGKFHGYATLIRRLVTFNAIGIFVLLAGIGAQWATVDAIGPTWSYVVQAVFSIELSYLLNRYLTWGDRKVITGSLWRWNVQRAVLTIPNYLGYAVLIHLRLPWLVANLTVTAVFVPVNYVLADRWSFTVRRSSTALAALPETSALGLEWLPTVSVVIPCKNNPSTIRATVESFLNQGYAFLTEVIVVGDVSDPTWAGLAQINDPRLIIVEHSRTPGLREPNIKRHEGILKASGEVVALADSDIVMDQDWLSRGIAMLRRQGSGLVAGGMYSIHDSFWGRFVDSNVLAAKTPRLARPYRVTAANFGKRGYKPPVSANAIFFRDLYDTTELDCTWFYGYEDYEWFWRVAKAGHIVTFDGQLSAAHHHRRSYRRLLQEYARSSEGCARFVHRHTDSPLARKRLLQGILLPPLFIGSLALMGAIAEAGYGLYLATAAGASCAALATREVWRTRRLEAIAYPFVGLSLAAAFAFSLTRNLVSARHPDHPVVQTWEDTLRRRRDRPVPWRWLGAFALVIAAATVVRLWHLGTSPEWQLDEITYNAAATSLVTHGTLSVPLSYGEAWQPFLYHPPFYLLLLSWWDRIVSVSIYSARLLGVLCTVIWFGLLARLLWRLHGMRSAFIALTLMAFDGWLIFVGRVSYIENVLLILIILALLAYERALRLRTLTAYLIAGVLLGSAAIFNSDGGYLLVVVVIHWLFIRRDTRLHLAALCTALAVVGGYCAAMAEIFTVNGTDWWLMQTIVQFRRITGQQSSAGTLNDPVQFLHLLTSQYGIFLPSVLAATVAVVMLATRGWASWRHRSLAPFGTDLLIPAWCLGALLVFGSATLHYTQYFVLVLLPLYCFVWTRLASHAWPLPVVVAAVTVIALLGMGSAVLRLRQDSNAFAELDAYAAKSIPRDAFVASGVGDPLPYGLSQPWCAADATVPRQSSYCFSHASYVLTWQTYLQSPNPLHLTELTKLLAESAPVKVFRSFSGEITVWKVKG